MINHSSSLLGRILWRILLVISFTMAMGITISWLQTYGGVNEMFDREMAQTARLYDELLSLYIDKVGSKNLEKNELFESWLKRYRLRETDPSGRRLRNYAKNVEFQVLNKQGEVLLKSPKAPSKAWSKLQSGYTNVIAIEPNTDSWRIYTSFNSDEGHWLTIAQNLDLRSGVITATLWQMGWPLILTIIILYILIPKTVKQALKPLKVLQEKLENRVPGNLQPFIIENASQELQDIMSALNGLLIRVKEAMVREQRFTSAAAHELRTPLTLLSLHAQAINQATDLKQVQQPSKELSLSIERARRLVQQLLHLAKAEAEESNQLHQVELLPLLRETLANLAPLALLREQNLSLNCNENKVVILGQTEQLRILLSNLVDNALRYTPDKGQVEIILRIKGNWVIIDVIDNGPGVEPCQLSQLCDRFYRANTSRGDGSGLGLAIVNTLATKHGGRLELNNRTDKKGFKATLYLLISEIKPTSITLKKQ